MSEQISPLHHYQVGGSLPPDFPAYVERRADRELYEGLTSGEFCYVFSSRQTGKSSLRVRVKSRLRAEGIVCSSIDLGSMGATTANSDEWCGGLADQITEDLKLESIGEGFDLFDWWKEQSLLSPIQRLDNFLGKIVLKKILGPIVIMIDEIDGIIGRDFSSDFCTLIRTCYNKRADNSNYKRLTFALIGVTKAEDLIPIKSSSPFNIGKAIQLSGFQLEEVQTLVPGLSNLAENPNDLLKEILSWTGGQPFLTQKICHLILSAKNSISKGSEAEYIQQLVKIKIIQNWEFQDEPVHLKNIRNRILHHEEMALRLLGLYQKILKGEAVNSNDKLFKVDLLLSGLIIERQGQLEIYNRIYEEVFNNDWVETQKFNFRFYAQALSKWIASGSKDTSCLLKGKDLRKALSFSSERNLSDEDYHFLSESQRLERLKLRHRLKVMLAFSVPSVISAFIAGVFSFSSCPEGTVRGEGGVCEQNLAKFSSGENTLFSLENDDFLLGIKEFENESYDQASQHFANAIEKMEAEREPGTPVDPEPWIYLNNAIARCHKNPYKIAVVVPIDSRPSLSKEVLRGVADAQGFFNGVASVQDISIEESSDEGQCNVTFDRIRERLLEVVIYDDQGDEDIAVNAALQIADSNYGILGVIGHLSSDLSEAALPQYDEARVAMITPTSTSTSLSDDRLVVSDVFFRAVPSDAKTAEVLSTYLKNKERIYEVMVFYDKESVYSNSLKDALRNQLGRGDVSSVDLSQSNLNLQEELDKAFSDPQINAVLLFPGRNTFSLALQIALDIEHENSNSSGKQLTILGGDSLYSPNILKHREKLEGLILAVPWIADSSFSYTRFTVAKWGGQISWRTASSFDATQALISVIKDLEASNIEISREQIIKHLQELCLNPDGESEVPGTSGKALKFDEKHNRVSSPVLVEVVAEINTFQILSGFKQDENSEKLSCP